MRIAHLISSGQLGGAEASLVEMVCSVRDAQPDWSFFVITPEHGPLEQRLESLGIPVDVLPFPPALARLGEAGRDSTLAERVRLGGDLLRSSVGAWAYRRELRALLGGGNWADAPAIVHAHGFKMHVLGAWAAPPGTMLIWHMHDYVSRRPVSARLLRSLAHRCDIVVANSMSVAADARLICGPARVETIYNAVDLTRFSPSGAVLDLDRLGNAPAAPRGTLRVGVLGTFARWKGQRTFLRALAKLSRGLQLRGYIIGGAVYQTQGSQQTESDLRQVAAELGIADRVVFTGPVRDAAGALRALDIVVHASTDPEPFGMVIAEAMGCGRPVLVSLAGGAAELVDDGIDGLGYEPGNEDRLAALITRLARDVSLRRRLAAAARASAERRFDRARLALELIPIYKRAGAAA